MTTVNKIKPDYNSLTDWEFYPSSVMIEYEQCLDEGLDIEQYKDIFEAVHKLPKGEVKKKFTTLYSIS